MSSDLIILNENPELPKDDEEEKENLQDPLVLSKNLSKLMKRLKGENFMDDSSVDYTTLVNSDVYKVDYAKMSDQLKKVDLDQLLDENNEKNDANLLAFFINIYNALTIHSIAYLSNLKESNVKGGSLLKQLGGKFWSKMAYLIGKDNQVFSLDDIEHGILRSNRPHPANRHPQFCKEDPRLKLAVKAIDSRIHFALNCGAKSCPPISFYTLDNLDSGLDMAARNFITNETSVDAKNASLQLSKLLLWYREDFTSHQKGDSDKIEFFKKAFHYTIIAKGLPLKWLTSIKKDDQLLIEYVFNNMKEGDEKKKLSELIESHCNGAEDKREIQITYKPYNFGINLKN